VEKLERIRINKRDHVAHNKFLEKPETFVNLRK
jgi:hypothetical protein